MSRRSLALLGALLTSVVLAGCGSSDDAAPSEGLPDGTYRVTVTEDAVRAAGYGNGPGWSGTWTLLVDDGTFTLACTPTDQLGIDCGGHPDPDSVPALEAGSVQVSGDTVTFVTRAADVAEINGCDVEAGECGGDWESQVTWAMDGDTVTFAAVDEVPMGVHLVVEPWQKIS